MDTKQFKLKRFYFLFFLLALSIHSFSQSGTSGNINWKIEGNSLILSGNGAMRDFTITSNPAPWYEYRESIQNLTIESGITSIGNAAFYFLSELISVEIPESVGKIGEYAFYRCRSLSSISIPGNLTTVGQYAFSDCQELTSLILNGNVTNMGARALSDCPKLVSLTINSSEPPTLANYVFSGVNKIRCTLILPFQMDLSVYLSADTQWNNFDKYNFINSWGTTGNLSWKIEDTILTITGEGEMPDYVYYSTYYKDNAPWYTWANTITRIVIEEGVTSIGNYAFNGCYNMVSVSLPNSLSAIRDNAFYYCYGLASVSIPENVTHIENTAFVGCRGISSIHVNAGNQVYTSEDGVLFNKDKTQLVRYPSMKAGDTYFIDATVKSIADMAFENSLNLKSITIPKSVTSIGGCAFAYCDELHLYFESQIAPWLSGVIYCEVHLTIDIPDGAIGYTEENGWIAGLNSKDYFESDNIIYSLLNRESKTFQVTGVTNQELDHAIIKESLSFNNEVYHVTVIGNEAFQGCHLLKEVRLPNTIELIDNYAFTACPFTSINFPENLMSIGKYAFSETGLLSVSFPGVSLNIGERAFAGCKGIESVTLPENIYFIDNYAFEKCDNLQSVTLYKMINFNNIFFDCEKLTDVVVGENIEFITNSAFLGCRWLRSVTLPGNLKQIGRSAFQGCQNLESINLPDSITTIGESAFSGCSSLTNITLPKNLGSLANYFFYECVSLISVELPETLRIIGNNAFYNCNNLNSIQFSKNITSIGDNAFYNCSNLTSIVIPENVINIGTNAFKGCFPKEVSAPIIIPDILTNKLEILILTGSESTGMQRGLLSNCESLRELSIPFIGTGTTSTGEDAVLGSIFGTTPNNNMQAVEQFYGEGKSTVYYMPKNLEKLTVLSPAANFQYGALYNCSFLKELVISSSVNGIAEKALYYCSGLEHIYAQRALPPAAFQNSFDGMSMFSCILHVPLDSKEYYQKATGWEGFYNIQEEAPVKINFSCLPLHGGMITGADEYELNTPALLQAIAHSGYTFQYWMEGENIVSTSSVYNFMATEPRTIYAVFLPKENGDESVRITPQPTEAEISWDTADEAISYTLAIYSDQAKTKELYRVELDENGNALKQSAKSTLSHTVRNLNPATPYYYTLTSYNQSKQALTISSGDFTTTEAGTSIGKVDPDKYTISIYPNPVSDILCIDIESEIKTISLFNETGRVIVNGSITDNKIDVSALSNGFYVLKIVTEKDIYTLRFLKK